MTVSRHIVLMLLAILLPVACGLSWLLYSGWLAQEHNLQQRLDALAVQQQQLLDYQLQSGQQIAATAANSQWAPAMQQSECRPALLSHALAGNASFSNLVTVDNDGEVICSVLPLDNAARQRVSSLPELPGLLQNTHPAISEPMFAPISRRWISAISHPIKQDGHIVGQVILSLDLKALDRITLPADLPDSVQWQVISPKGRLLQASDASLHLATLPVLQEGMIHRLQVLTNTRWQVQVSMPQWSLRATLLKQGIPLMAGMLLAVLIAAVCGYLLARYLLRSVNALTSFVLRVAKGENSLRVEPDGPSELRVLGSEINRMLDAMEFSESRYRLLFGASTDGVIVVNRQMLILAVNEQCASMFGYSVEELTGQSINILLPVELRAAHQHIAANYAANPVGRGMGHRPTLRGLHKNGGTVLVQITLSPLPQGSQGIAAAIIRDVSERQQLKDQLLWMSQYDSLTRLPNRFLLIDRLGQAVQRSQQHGQPLALILIGLDHFKVINDAYGHDCGDTLLIQLAQRLCTAAGDTRTVARVGGDEFAIIIDDQASPQQLPAIIERLRQRLQRPLDGPDMDKIQISCSIGVALYPADASDSRSLLKAADTALAAAKQLGRGNIRFYREDETADYRQELELEIRLREAIAEDQLQPYFQPIVDTRSGRIIAVEALVRWPQREGMISPALFLPLAENAGLLPTLEQQTRRKALQAIRHWNNLGYTLQLSINVSAGEFESSDFIETLDRQLRHNNIDPGQIVLEITESAVLHHQDSAVARMQDLHSRGYRIAIDDFGTGYSSLSYLHTFPFDRLKLDRSFIAQLPQDEKAGMVTAAIIGMAHDLGLNVVAEGVETAAQQAMLAKMKCDALQGFYLHKPLPLEAVSQLLLASRLEEPAMH